MQFCLYLFIHSILSLLKNARLGYGFSVHFEDPLHGFPREGDRIEQFPHGVRQGTGGNAVFPVSYS